MQESERQTYPLVLVGIIAIVSLAIGGFHLYVTHRVRQAVDQVLGSIRVVNFAQIPLSTEPLHQLQFYLEVENTAPDTVEVSISDTQIQAEGDQLLSLGRLLILNETRATLAPGESAQFVGQVMISDEAYQRFQARQQAVLFRLSGLLEARAAVLWVSHATATRWSIEHRVSFS
jgi:hypothetical protein